MLFGRSKPKEVFTPRAPRVNQKMYISRFEQERAMKRALDSNYCIVIYGDSGCGKSWLYRKVFADLGVSFSVLDLGTCQDQDDVDLILLDRIARLEEFEIQEKEEERELDIRPMRAGVREKKSLSYKRNVSSPFKRMCTLMRSEKNFTRGVIVFENVEHIIDKPNLISFIQSKIMEIDNNDEANGDISIAVVGVPFELSKILSEGNHYQTISNRIYEIPEMGQLEPDQAEEFMKRGFIELLKLKFSYDFDLCLRAIATATNRVPQYLHDVCLLASLAAEEADGEINQELVEKAIVDWVVSSDKSAFTLIDSIVSSDKSSGRLKSKVLFCLAQIEDPYFSKDDITALLEKFFPRYCDTVKPATKRTLSSLSKISTGILKASKDGNHFQIRTPAIRGALRSSLTLQQDDEEVKVRRLKHSGLAFDENYPKSIQW